MLCVSGAGECSGCGQCVRKTIHECADCAADIHEGEEAYFIGGEWYCTDCINNARTYIYESEEI